MEILDRSLDGGLPAVASLVIVAYWLLRDMRTGIWAPDYQDPDIADQDPATALC